MKVLLTTLNSKFIHSNLAIHYLYSYWERYKSDETIKLELKEYTINHNLDQILSDIVNGEYDAIVVSAYVWNIEALDILFSNFNQINHNIPIYFGGPEVSAHPETSLANRSYLKGILYGEGERVFYNLMTSFLEKKEGGILYDKVRGLAFKTDVGTILINSSEPLIKDLDSIPFPYQSLAPFKNRIIYYESMRGCPFQCSYCLSAKEKGVRFFSLQRVKKDLDFFLAEKIPQVKFVDRTFNINKNHALAIMNYVCDHDNGITNFHFEITGTLLDEDYFNVIKRSRAGLFQFEIGIQTTHYETLIAINRPIDKELLFKNIKKLMDTGKLHIHLDLIAGLPYENFDTFLNSFDEAYNLLPHQLQLGFLKIIKGTPLESHLVEHDYLVRKQSPYEILSNRYIDYQSLSLLKDVETLLEVYYNSQKFRHSIQYAMVASGIKASQFFLQLRTFYEKQNKMYAAINIYERFELLNLFQYELEIDHDLFNDLLKLDYYLDHLTGNRTIFHYAEQENFNFNRNKLIKNKDVLSRVNSRFANMSTKEILKSITLISLRYDIIELVKTGYNHVILKDKLILINFEFSNYQLEPYQYHQFDYDETIK